MPSAAKEEKVHQAMWKRVQPVLPAHPPRPKGGRPPVDDEKCFRGIVYLLRNGGRWQDIPKEYGSGSTCWRRYNLWCELGIWDLLHQIILEELQKLDRIDTNEFFADATFAEAQKGGQPSARQNAAKAPILS